MKHTKTFLTRMVSLLALAFLCLGGAMAEEYIMTPNQASTGFSDGAYITSLTSFTYNNVTWKMNQWNPKTLQVKTNQTKNTSEFYFYNSTEIPGSITQVVLTFSALSITKTSASGWFVTSGVSVVGTDNLSTDNSVQGVWDENAKTLTFDISGNSSYITVWQNGKVATGNNYLASDKAIKITYTPKATNVATPTLSVAEGEYDQPQTVALSTETNGASIYYTLDGTTPTTKSNLYTTPITISETTTIRAIAYKNGEASNETIRTITILSTYNTIADFKQSSVKAVLNLTDAVVTAVSGTTNVYIQDATGGICLYKNLPALTVGQRLNGKIVGKYGLYNQLPQLQDGNYDNVIVTDGEAPTPKDINIDEITEADYCTLVTIKGAHCAQLKEKAEITQDNNTGKVTVYTTFMTSFPSCQNFDVTGILGIYNGTIQILPRNKADFVDNGGEKETIMAFGQSNYTLVVGLLDKFIRPSTNSSGTITYSSSDESVLTVDEEGYVTPYKKGNAVITASVAAKDGYPAASASVPVKVVDKTCPEVKMLVAELNGKFYAISCVSTTKEALGAVEIKVKDGVALNENMDNLLWYVDKEDGFLLSMQSGEFIDSDGTSNKLMMVASPCKWTYDENGWSNGNWFLQYSSGSNVFKAYASSNLTNKTFASAHPMPYSLAFNLSDDGLATYYNGEENIVMPEGITGWTYTYDGSNVTAHRSFEAGDVVPVGTGVLLYATVPDYYAFDTTTTGNTSYSNANNVLTGQDKAGANTNGKNHYVLGTKNGVMGFYQVTSAYKFAAHKAYIELPAGSSASYVALNLGGEDTIESVEAEAQAAGIYTISGAKVQRPAKGLYIINGKKVVR